MARGRHKSKERKSARTPKSDCIIPPRVPDKVLNQYTLGRNQNEAKEIAEYVEWQCAKDKEHVTFSRKSSNRTHSREPLRLLERKNGATLSNIGGHHFPNESLFARTVPKPRLHAFVPRVGLMARVVSNRKSGSRRTTSGIVSRLPFVDGSRLRKPLGRKRRV